VKRIHQSRLKALIQEGKRLDAAYEKLHEDRLTLAIDACPFTPGDEVVVGVERIRCRVTWVDAPPGLVSKRLWRMTVRPHGSPPQRGWEVFDDTAVERWKP
jgi:hypothetical protein